MNQQETIRDTSAAAAETESAVERGEAGACAAGACEAEREAVNAVKAQGHRPVSADVRRAKMGAAVDMVATARSVQEASASWQDPSTLKIVAPAKVNLFLGIGKRRDDGYHEAANVLHAVALHDVLYMRRAQEGKIPESAFEAGEAALAGSQRNLAVRVSLASCEGTAPLPVACADNIVFCAANALACELGITRPDALEMRLEKHIPHQAGLGGGSSDAAAALLGAAKFWGVAPDDPAVERVARTLGSDVAFFLHGGCAYFDGAGEQFVRTLEPMKRPIVLIKPAVGVSTAAAYRVYDEEPVAVDENGLRRAETAACAADVFLFNNLSAAAERLVPELSAIREWAHVQPGVTDVLLCGSGSATFAIVDDFGQASRLSAAAQAKGWWARTTLLGSLGAAIVPK